MDFGNAFSKLKPLTDDLQKLREKAVHFAQSQGLPSRKDENWKYTSVREIGESQFLPAATEDIRPSHRTLSELAGLFNEDFHRLVFVNGQLDRTLSSVDDLPSGVQWSSQPEKILAAAVSSFEDSFEALNLAYASEGLWMKIPSQTSLGKPLQIHFHTSAEGRGSLMVVPRVVIEVGEGSVASILESYSSEGSPEVKHLSNAMTRVSVAKNARVTHVRLQDEDLASYHVGTTDYEVAQDSELTSLVVSLGARLFRHRLRLPLKESGVKVRALGISLTAGSQHVDNTTDIDHQVGACDTEQIYKSLLDGESRAVFNGRIYIRPKAQKANSSQLNNNLLLSSKAEADSQPQLMIEADDVKAAHGSTVGHLDAEELFYLQSRGLSRQAAVPLLAYGFLADLLEQIESEPIQRWMTGRLKKHFSRLNTEAL